VLLVYTLSVIGCGVELGSGQSNDYKIGIYCLSAEHDELRKRVKTGWLGFGTMYVLKTDFRIVKNNMKMF